MALTTTHRAAMMARNAAAPRATCISASWAMRASTRSVRRRRTNSPMGFSWPAAPATMGATASTKPEAA